MVETNALYWNDKLAAFFHDPFDKALNIPGHEKRASQYLEAFGLKPPEDKFWKMADILAAGFERGVFPGYQADVQKSGAVDFLKHAIITHPVSSNDKLDVLLAVDSVNQEEIIKLIESDMQVISQGDEIKKARNRFFYVYFLLRYRLSSKNIGGLGALWHRLPADTRIPDHSIWHHNALVSSLYSSMELAKAEEGIGLAVFSITPVQGFIAKARKLRDYWTSSVLLSWLAFEGIRYVIEQLGPDHVLYPSLLDQPLVELYLKKIPGFDSLIQESCLPKPLEIATLPNKFLFVLPFGKANEFCEAIKQTVIMRWNELCDLIQNSVAERCIKEVEDKKVFFKIFKRQTEHFWDIDFACTKLVGERDIAKLNKFFEEEVYSSHNKLSKLFNTLVEGSSQGCFYTVSHRLAQSALASAKIKRKIRRNNENGEKCHLCGQFEVLHTIAHPENLTAKQYVHKIKIFWDNLKNAYSEYDFNEGEKLCAVCLVKRLAAQVTKEKQHLLSGVFENADAFPSTTEMALNGYFKRCGIDDKNKRWLYAQQLHQKDEFEREIKKELKQKLREEDKYLAILLMDGDNMGSLINGESVAARWETVLHPEVIEKIQRKTFEERYVKIWNEIFNDSNIKKRMLSPALHATISEALSDFSLFSVKNIIEQFSGRLIYAGGDDVCAVLPAFNALPAAREIQKMYSQPFVFIDDMGKPAIVEKNWEPQPGKITMHLGKGEKISISAAILICHHKESLSEMISRAHSLLELYAKEMCGRNACAIELKKRSGGSRYFAAKWDNLVWESFQNLIMLLGTKGTKERLSTSLIYRLDEMRDGIIPLIEKDESLQLYRKFVQKLLTKSLFSEQDPNIENISSMIVQTTYMNKKFVPEGLIIANFLAGGEQ